MASSSALEKDGENGRYPKRDELTSGLQALGVRRTAGGVHVYSRSPMKRRVDDEVDACVGRYYGGTLIKRVRIRERSRAQHELVLKQDLQEVIAAFEEAANELKERALPEIRLPRLVQLLRRRPREAVMAGTAVLGSFAGLCLASGLILDRVVIAPDVGLGVLLMSVIFFGMAVAAKFDEQS